MGRKPSPRRPGAVPAVRSLTPMQQLQFQLLLRDTELLRIRTQQLLADFRATLRPGADERMFDPETMTFRAVPR